MNTADTELKQQVKELEQQVKELSAQLAQANKEMEAFTYSVSHDLRSPLRGIDGWSQALAEDFGEVLEEKAKIYLGRIRNETMRMHELIEALLRLSRISRRDINAEWVDVSAMAAGILEKFQQQEPERKVSVNIEAGLKVLADKFLMEIALENLLSNAWKFSSKKELAQIEIGTKIINGENVFYIRDNGAGFNPAYAKKLFGAFQRMHKPADYPGIGIGLATVQRIILRHGGNIWVETAVDEGATFYWIIRS
jgi:light-regulated signal transduction histidine kinase (bacteriophytochrome)